MKNYKTFAITRYDDNTMQCFLNAQPNCIIFQVSRSHLLSINTEIDEKLKDHSIYFLLNRETKQMYIGKSNVRVNGESVRQRLLEHNKSKDFWNEAYIYSNDQLEENITRIIESKLIYEFKNKYYYLENKNDGGRTDSKSKVTEEIAEHHFQNIKELISILVYDIFWQKENMKNMCYINKNHNYDNELNIIFENNEISKNNIYLDQFNNLNDNNEGETYPEFYFNRSGYKATMVMINNKKYILKNGSEISENLLPSAKNTVKKRREENERFIMNNRLTQDIEFSSSSAVAEFVCGGPASGNET